MPGLSHALLALIRRDVRLVVRHPSEVAHPVMFFIIVVAVFPFGVGSDPALLREIAPGIIWVGALLATLLSLDALFRSDFEDGTLEQLALSGHPLTILVLGKVFVHWCATGLPLLIATPLLGLFLGMTTETQLTLLTALVLGTPTLSLIGSVGTALTVGIRRGGLLLTLLVLPLYVPVLIFGASGVLAANAGLPAAGHFYFLGAMMVLALVLAPLAASAALRISLN
ncbi:MAG TPA: heme exporter protein CcmB [Gammaproteobacteria bacterium]|nr:heme exporter protein CcmB [Gammaproteobacteria bacterium]|tara:strand:- start:577 stop:1254 length:678 start_codon:yes stop_codon:yes gene_type:complete